jgi:hypothetical protein
MHQLALLSVVAWSVLLSCGYLIARYQDPLPRNHLRNLVHQQFLQERLSWKLIFLAESLTIFFLLCMSPTLACALLYTRSLMLAASLYPYLRTAHRRQAHPEGDPVFAWYRRSWPHAH